MDLQLIADHLEFDIEDVQMLVDMFLENAYQSLDDLNQAIQDSNYDGIKNASHAIKGSSANLLLEDITTLASKIEEFAKNRSNIDYEKLVKELKYRVVSLEEKREMAW
jgi:HPt (histidine-containing phosphotransfer) domain-containing protein